MWRLNGLFSALLQQISLKQIHYSCENLLCRTKKIRAQPSASGFERSLIKTQQKGTEQKPRFLLFHKKTE